MLEIKVTLRIKSKIFDLNSLSKILGEPSYGYSMGEETATGNREFTLWALNAKETDDNDINSQINEIIAFLESNDKSNTIFSNCELNLFCMLSSDNGQGGSVISAECLKNISKYRMDLVLDVYA